MGTKWLAFTLLIGSFGIASATTKPTQFWNLTSETVTLLQLAPAGTEQFGPNQCLNDKDNSVDHDERLKIKDLESGSYDVKIGNAKGLTCQVKNLAIESGKIFSIEDRDLTNCNQ
jgi:hypothetical protein